MIFSHKVDASLSQVPWPVLFHDFPRRSSRGFLDPLLLGNHRFMDYKGPRKRLERSAPSGGIPMRRTLLGLVVFSLAFLAASAETKKDPILIVKPDAFKTLVNPNCSHCRDEAKRRAGELRKDDRVLCWIRDTKGKYEG